jgi:ectoine hydroxylase-related dioxygenase (phytanoyl-CoA dioxygenase family)
MERVEVLRGALDADWLTEFERLCRSWFSSIEQRLAEPRELEANPQLQMIARQSGLPLNLFLNQSKPPAGVNKFFDVVQQSQVWSGVAQGLPLFLLKDSCSVRRQKPDKGEEKKAFRWHQDSAVVISRTRAVGVSGYVAWVPITPIDDATPSLQLIPEWSEPLAHIVNPNNFYWESSREPTGEIMTVNGLARGDILLFDLNCPHRTYLAPGMTKDRLSIDLRLVHSRPANYTGELIPLASVSRDARISRNELCPCGSGKKYKHCHGVW